MRKLSLISTAATIASLALGGMTLEEAEEIRRSRRDKDRGADPTEPDVSRRRNKTATSRVIDGSKVEYSFTPKKMSKRAMRRKRGKNRRK